MTTSLLEKPVEVKTIVEPTIPLAKLVEPTIPLAKLVEPTIPKVLLYELCNVPRSNLYAGLYAQRTSLACRTCGGACVLDEQLAAPAIPCTIEHRTPKHAGDITFSELDVVHYLETHGADEVIGVSTHALDCLIARALKHKYPLVSFNVRYGAIYASYAPLSLSREIRFSDRIGAIVEVFDSTIWRHARDTLVTVTKREFLTCWHDKGYAPLGRRFDPVPSVMPLARF